jgi:hypothetical protein
VFTDNQEYKNSVLVNIVRKLSWRFYSNVRNLILAVRHSRNKPLFHMVVLMRLIQECAVTLIARDEKLRRLSLLARGARDGYRGVEEMVSLA